MAFVKGGTTPMHSARGVGNQKPGVSSQQGSSAITSGQAPDPGPSSAGYYSTETTNKDFAGTAQASGTSGPTKQGGNSKFAEGGKSPMFGHRGSLAARGGYTTPG